MSMRYSGRASRTFIMGIRLCPPLKILAASPYRSNNATASVSVPGLQYSNDWGIILFLLSSKAEVGHSGQGDLRKPSEPDLATNGGSDVRGLNEIDHYPRTKSAFSIENWFEGAPNTLPGV